MAGVDTNTMGRARLDFADEHDIDEFVDVLGKYERARPIVFASTPAILHLVRSRVVRSVRL